MAKASRVSWPNQTDGRAILDADRKQDAPPARWSPPLRAPRSQRQQPSSSPGRRAAKRCAGPKLHGWRTYVLAVTYMMEGSSRRAGPDPNRTATVTDRLVHHAESATLMRSSFGHRNLGIDALPSIRGEERSEWKAPRWLKIVPSEAAHFWTVVDSAPTGCVLGRRVPVVRRRGD